MEIDDDEDEGFLDDKSSQTSENDDLGPLEEVENFSDEDEDEEAEETKEAEKEAFYNESEEDWDISLEGVPVERKYSAVEELDDDEVIVATVAAHIDDESNEPLEEASIFFYYFLESFLETCFFDGGWLVLGWRRWNTRDPMRWSMTAPKMMMNPWTSWRKSRLAVRNIDQ